MKKENIEDIETSLSGEESTITNADGEVKPKWYQRRRSGITTQTSDKKETPEGLWNKCPELFNRIS